MSLCGYTFRFFFSLWRKRMRPYDQGAKEVYNYKLYIRQIVSALWASLLAR